MPPVNTVQPRCPWPLAALAAWRPHRCPPQAAPAAAGSAWPWRTARLPGRARRGRWPGCRPGGQFARQGSHGVSNKRMKQPLHALGSSLARSRGDTCRSSPACTAGRPQPCHDTAGTGHAPEARDRKASAATRGADGRLAKQGQAFAAGLRSTNAARQAFRFLMSRCSSCPAYTPGQAAAHMRCAGGVAGDTGGSCLLQARLGRLHCPVHRAKGQQPVQSLLHLQGRQHVSRREALEQVSSRGGVEAQRSTSARGARGGTVPGAQTGGAAKRQSSPRAQRHAPP